MDEAASLKTIYSQNAPYAPSDYADPEWGSGGMVHQWKNYISEDLRMAWPSFSYIQRATIAESADDACMREEWD